MPDCLQLPTEVAAGLEEAVEEMRAGRFWHGGRELREALGGEPGAPEHVLLAARAAAGWGDWPEAERLLKGREWLSQVEGGLGLVILALAAEAREEWLEAAEAYGQYLELVGGQRACARALAGVRRTLSLARGGSDSEAVAELARTRETVGAFLGSWVALHAARILAEEGKPDGTRRALETITDDQARGRSGVVLARAHLEAGDSAAARELYAQAVASSEGAERPGLEVALGELAVAQGDTAAGLRAYQRALGVGPEGEAVAVAAERLMRLTDLADAELAERASEALLRNGRDSLGLEAMNASLRLRDEGPADLSGSLRLLRARLLAAHGSREEAARELSLLADSPEPSLAGPALWHLLQLRRRQGRTGEADTLEERLVRDLPERPEAVDVVFFRGDRAHDRGRLDAAAQHYGQVVSMAPALNRAGLARMRLGQLHLQRGHPTEALEVFESYLEEFPEGRRWEEATFWAARSRLALHDTTAAEEYLTQIQEREPLSYYAVLAAQLSDQPYRLPTGAEATEATTPPWLIRGLRNVDLAVEAGLDEAVDVVVERLKARARAEDPTGGVLLALGEELNRRGLTPLGINLGWEVRGLVPSWNRRLLRVVYPLPYLSLLRREAEEWGVDPFLVAAIMRQESAFWREAVSRAGAVGLMQVMPGTGRALARSVGPEEFRRAALENPEINLHLGVRFFADMLDRFGPELPLVLSAYNAGPTRATRWSRFPEASDPLRFTERIPFTETRGYVKNVVRNRAVYEALYGDPQMFP